MAGSQPHLQGRNPDGTFDPRQVFANRDPFDPMRMQYLRDYFNSMGDMYGGPYGAPIAPENAMAPASGYQGAMPMLPPVPGDTGYDAAVAALTAPSAAADTADAERMARAFATLGDPTSPADDAANSERMARAFGALGIPTDATDDQDARGMSWPAETDASVYHAPAIPTAADIAAMADQQRLAEAFAQFGVDPAEAYSQGQMPAPPDPMAPYTQNQMPDVAAVTDGDRLAQGFASLGIPAESMAQDDGRSMSWPGTTAAGFSYTVDTPAAPSPAEAYAQGQMPAPPDPMAPYAQNQMPDVAATVEASPAEAYSQGQMPTPTDRTLFERWREVASIPPATDDAVQALTSYAQRIAVPTLPPAPEEAAAVAPAVAPEAAAAEQPAPAAISDPAESDPAQTAATIKAVMPAAAAVPAEATYSSIPQGDNVPTEAATPFSSTQISPDSFASGLDPHSIAALQHLADNGGLGTLDQGNKWGYSINGPTQVPQAALDSRYGAAFTGPGLLGALMGPDAAGAGFGTTTGGSTGGLLGQFGSMISGLFGGPGGGGGGTFGGPDGSGNGGGAPASTTDREDHDGTS